MNNIIKISRIFLGIMFLFSGISKILSLPFFDSMVAELFLGANYYDNASGLQLTQMLSRVLIASEMLLGAAVLQEKWLKKIVLPSLFAMLLIFTVHLFYEGLTSPKGFIEGNCGCFGDILPINNLESIIKNMVADAKTKALLIKAGKLSDGKTMNLETGEQLVCLFSMTCGHCQEVYKEICGFSTYAKLPQVYLLNFGKEFEQQYFFNQGGNCNFPYFRTEDYTLFKRMLEGESFPRILVIRDGKIVKTWNLDSYSREGFMKFLSIPEKQPKKDGLDLQKPGSWGGEEKKPWE